MTAEDKKEGLGIIIPVYRSTLSVRLLLEQIHLTLKELCPFHIYLIDDSGSDTVSSYLKEHCKESYVTLITLKKNYGQQAAILCGLRFACRHEAVITMDDDLQHPADILPSLYQKLSEGFDLVYAIASNRKEKLVRQLGSCLRDQLFSHLFFQHQKTKVSSFRIMTQETAQNTASFHGGFFYFSAAALQKGINGKPLKTANLSYEKPGRPYGKSGYSLRKLALLFWKLLCHYTPLASITEFFEKENCPLYEIKEITPKLMILGGSNCQLHGFLRAKERSIYTILADYTKNPPAKAAADVHAPVSTFDAPACIEAGRRHQINGIMTLGTDQPVLTASLVSEALSLPGFLSPEQARAVTNKYFMKKVLKNSGIKTAAYLFLSENREFLDETGKQVPFTLKPPYVIKPVDSQGQRGIFTVNTKEELFSCLPETLAFSREKLVLVEEYYESDEITVSGWMEKGALTILTITDRLLYPDSTHIGVCIGHRFPSIHIDQFQEIKEICDRITVAFSLKSGPFYLQLLTGKNGIFVNELACRIGGAFEDITIPYLTGFSILDAVIDGALGYPSVFPFTPGFRCDTLEKASFVLLLFCRPGKISYITAKEELLSLPYLLDCGFNYPAGSQIPTVENATARFGHAVIAGTKENIPQYIEDFYKHFKVLDNDGNNLVQIFHYFKEKN